MTISSRTPEGRFQQCPICGKPAMVEPSDPGGDAPCPSCGHLLWFQNHLSERYGVDADRITLSTSFVNDLGADSLDTVELVMELEEEFDITLPDDVAERINTVGEAIEYIEKIRKSRGD